VEGGIALAGIGCFGWGPGELAGLPDPILAGDAFGGHPGHVGEGRGDLFRGAVGEVLVGKDAGVVEASFERRADSGDPAEVIAGLAGGVGLGAITLRHRSSCSRDTPGEYQNSLVTLI